MKSGQLRQLVTFQSKTEVNDSFGNSVEAWSDAFNEMAAFEQLGSKEFPTAWKRYAETTARFRIRYRAGIDSDKHRIVMIFDESASPQVSSIWNIFPPEAADGKGFELIIEASQIL